MYDDSDDDMFDSDEDEMKIDKHDINVLLLFYDSLMLKLLWIN